MVVLAAAAAATQERGGCRFRPRRHGGQEGRDDAAARGCGAGMRGDAVAREKGGRKEGGGRRSLEL